MCNNTGATYDFIVDGSCRDVGNRNEITTTTSRLNTGEVIDRHARLGICSSGVLATLTYDQAMNADIVINGGDGDCRVNYTGTDR